MRTIDGNAIAGLLMVVTRVRGIYCLDLQGIAALDRPPDARAEPEP